MVKFISSLFQYSNGNYQVTLLNDGTKIRRTSDIQFRPLFPESIDLKITNQCDQNCPMCHERSEPLGKHANLDAPFLKTLTAGTELAIGGGNPLCHPGLIPFLEALQKKGIVANMTIHQNHLYQDKTLVEDLLTRKLIYGLGISIVEATDDLIDFCQKNGNAVIHVIAGYHSVNLFEKLSHKGLKILILGYKKYGRGESFFNPSILEKIDALGKYLFESPKSFKIISFDNLAIQQLSLKEHISHETWDRSYMGDEGRFSMYIDLVKEEYAINSTSPTRYPIKESIETMFQHFAKGEENGETNF